MGISQNHRYITGISQVYHRYFMVYHDNMSYPSIMRTLFQIRVDSDYFHFEFLHRFLGHPRLAKANRPRMAQVVTATEQQPRVTGLRMGHWPIGPLGAQ